MANDSGRPPLMEYCASSGRPPLQGWETLWLTEYRRWGRRHIACDRAGISHDTVTRREHESLTFAQQVHDAHQGFLDDMEGELVRMTREKSNVIACLARLKADRPDRYVERLQLSGTITSGPAMSAEEARAFLRLMVQEATPTTRAMLAAPTEPVPAPDTVSEADWQSGAHPLGTLDANATPVPTD